MSLNPNYRDAWNDGYTSGLANARDHLNLKDEDLGDLWEETSGHESLEEWLELDQSIYDEGYQNGYEAGYNTALLAIVRSIFNLNKIDLSGVVSDWQEERDRLFKNRERKEDE